MSDAVIQVDNLSKRYRLGLIGTGTLSHDLNRWWARIRGKPDPYLKIGQNQQAEDADFMWALRDVSFEVARGEVLGIIGRNGAGKSTLLKILSRVTAPTGGEVHVRGRIASLLEVGTGFHPELTGRENVFLNGAILGMSKAEIKKKFAEIVAFSEVEKFIDTPVKRYSSGMYVRLAFAVAAHLDPEILVVDEVLAVGDAAFQNKCLGRMKDIGAGGRTVLFVSHNMGAIAHLCDKALLLDSGAVIHSGEVSETIEKYHSNVNEVSYVDLDGYVGNRRGMKEFATIRTISTHDSGGRQQTVFGMGEVLVVRMTVDFKRAVRGALFGIMLRNSAGVLLHDFRSAFDGFFPDFEAGRALIQVTVPAIKVYPGFYTIGAWIQQQVGVASDDYVSEVFKIQITDKRLIGDPRSNFEFISKEGTEVYHQCMWHVTNIAGPRN